MPSVQGGLVLLYASVVAIIKSGIYVQRLYPGGQTNKELITTARFLSPSFETSHSEAMLIGVTVP